MRHSLITIHLLHQARDNAVAQAEPTSGWSTRPGRRLAPSPPRRAGSLGSSPWPVAPAPWRHGPPDRPPDRTR
jgi:hypothetical protein